MPRGYKLGKYKLINSNFFLLQQGIEQLTVSIQESLAKYADRTPIRSEFKNHFLYLVVCKTLPSTHNISHQVKITVK